MGLRLPHLGSKGLAQYVASRREGFSIQYSLQEIMADAGDGFRGPAPTSFQPFFRSSVRLSHATVFTSIHEALCQRSMSLGKSWDLQPGLENGERLCTAYEIFREWEPTADMEFDQAALLARGAASSEDIELFRCLHCQSAMLIDKWARRREVCSGCRGRRSASP